MKKVLTIGFVMALAVAAHAQFTPLEATFASSVEIENLTGRPYILDTVYIKPADSTAQTLTFGVKIGATGYDLTTVAVAGAKAWTVDGVVLMVPAGGKLTVASTEAGVTNSLYMLRAEMGDYARYAIRADLANGSVTAAKLEAAVQASLAKAESAIQATTAAYTNALALAAGAVQAAAGYDGALTFVIGDTTNTLTFADGQLTAFDDGGE